MIPNLLKLKVLTLKPVFWDARIATRDGITSTEHFSSFCHDSVFYISLNSHMYRLHVFDSQGNNRQRRDHFPRLETYWVLSANTNMLLTNRNLMWILLIIPSLLCLDLFLEIKLVLANLGARMQTHAPGLADEHASHCAIATPC